jgi:hypothetical protein
VTQSSIFLFIQIAAGDVKSAFEQPLHTPTQGYSGIPEMNITANSLPNQAASVALEFRHHITCYFDAILYYICISSLKVDTSEARFPPSATPRLIFSLIIHRLWTIL